MAKGLTKEELIAHAQEEFRNSSNWQREKVVERWRKSNALYNSEFSAEERAKSDVLLGQGRLFIPKTYTHVQRILVDIIETFFFDPEEIVSIGNWKNIPYETREIVKTILNYRLNGNPINFYQEVYEACLDALKNKVGIFKVYPTIKTGKVIDPLTGVEVERITEFYPNIDACPYEDVFFHPQATWKDYWQYPIIHRVVRNIDYLRRQGYKNLKELETISVTVPAADEIKLQRSLDTGSPFVNNTAQRIKSTQRVYVYEVWTFLDVNNDGYLESCSYSLAGDESGPSILIRGVEENTLPYMKEGDIYNRSPFVVGFAFPEPHQFYGKDLPQIVEGLQKETNALRNQRREAVALSLRRPILANRSANLDLLSLVNRKIGSVVLGDDVSPASIRELDIGNPTQNSIIEQGRTDQDFFEATSIPPNLLGMPASKEETATAVTAHVANANKKISLIIKNLANTLIIPALKLLLRLEQEYGTDEFVALVTGRKLGLMFSSDDIPPKKYIQGEFDLTVNVGINKMAQLNKFLMFLDRTAQVNTVTANLLANGVVSPDAVRFINPFPLFQRMLSILGEKNFEDYMVQARPPVAQSNIKGVASQAKPPGDISSMNPNLESVYGTS